MPQLQFDESFERNNLRRFYGLVILAMVLSQCWPWGGIGMRVMAGVVGGLMGFGIASVLEKAAVRWHRCPRCHTRIGRSPYDFVRWDKIVLHCPRCEIDWDLGIQPPQRSEESNPWDNWFRQNLAIRANAQSAPIPPARVRPCGGCV